MMVHVHPDAADEYAATFEWYYRIDPALGDDFQLRVTEQVRLIQGNPRLYHIRKFTVRRANLSRFKEYYLAYTIWREKVVILAVGHSKRRPYYFRKRIGEARRMF